MQMRARIALAGRRFDPACLASRGKAARCAIYRAQRQTRAAGASKEERMKASETIWLINFN